MRIPGQVSTDRPATGDVSTVAGNERLTALTGTVLLILIVVELVTTANLRTLMSIHIVVGVLLAGPLAVKFGSTGYRFLRYYTRSPAYVRKGPPRLALRILAPVFLATTLVVIASGIGLLVTSPTLEGPMLRVHAISSLIWIPLLAVHVFAYILQALRGISDDWSTVRAAQAPGRDLRLGVNVGALIGGAVASILLLPAASPWIAWSATNGNNRPAAPLIAGLLVSGLTLLAITLLRRQ